MLTASQREAETTTQLTTNALRAQSGAATCKKETYRCSRCRPRKGHLLCVSPRVPVYILFADFHSILYSSEVTSQKANRRWFVWHLPTSQSKAEEDTCFRNCVLSCSLWLRGGATPDWYVSCDKRHRSVLSCTGVSMASYCPEHLPKLKHADLSVRHTVCSWPV